MSAFVWLLLFTNPSQSLTRLVRSPLTFLHCSTSSRSLTPPQITMHHFSARICKLQSAADTSHHWGKPPPLNKKATLWDFQTLLLLYYYFTIYWTKDNLTKQTAFIRKATIEKRGFKDRFSKFDKRCKNGRTKESGERQSAEADFATLSPTFSPLTYHPLKSDIRSEKYF